jgi:flavodoxin
VEIRAGHRPALESALDDVESYDTVFVGSPNWWNTLAPPVATFLSEHDLSGKTVVPFCSHGGGGLGSVAADVAELCPRSTVLRSFHVYGSGGIDAQARVAAWLRQLGMAH